MFKLENMASIGCNKIQTHLRYVVAPLYKQKNTNLSSFSRHQVYPNWNAFKLDFENWKRNVYTEHLKISEKNAR